MKKAIFTAAIVLLTVGVYAQNTGTGMPKELTCTEKAFNFSFSVGSKLQLSKPKMGPVEAASYETDYMPAWALKAKVTPEPTVSIYSYNTKDKPRSLIFSNIFATNRLNPTLK